MVKKGADPPAVTELLRAWSNGDLRARDELVPLVQDQLRRIARQYLRREAHGNTLQTTALVNEAYLRLIDVSVVRWQDRAHFFAISAKLIRRILVEAARARNREKRGGGNEKVPLEECAVACREKDRELLALDDALQALAQKDARKAQVVELRFFAGLTEVEIAEILKISPETVRRDWHFAKLWLAHEIKPEK